MANIYLLDIGNINLETISLEKELSANILSIVSKYKLQDDYLRSLVGWYLLTKYLKEDFFIDLKKENIEFNQYNKPYINKNIHFNITHSGNFVGIIISNNECGIDIEVYKENRDWDKIRKIILNEETNNYTIEELVKVWTMKEAYFKRIGTGINLTNLKKLINEKEVQTLKIYDIENNIYYLSYSIENNKRCKINRLNKI